MKRFNPTKAFKKLRVESQNERQAWADFGRRKQEQWTAHEQRQKAFHCLMNIFPSEGAGTLDVGVATKLIIEYAQTLPAKWVANRVRFASDRLAKLAEDGKSVRDANLKEILLNLLLLAREGDQTKVAEIFDEAMRGDPNDVESFRLCLVNWLVDKVVDTSPPVPEELTPPVEASAEEQEKEAPLDVSSTLPAKEEWLPATEAVERAEQKGFSVNIKWLTQDSPRHGVRIRKRQQPGRHKKEVEWTSLAGYLLKKGHLLKQAPAEEESDEEVLNSRIQEARKHKRTIRSLD
jgi:hypothetical protein